MNLKEYKTTFSADDAAPGWDAIDNQLKITYGDTEPRHWGTAIKYMLGGPDPIDGFSAYLREENGELYEHIVTYGFSELYYSEESLDNDYSKYGFELTFRIKVKKEGEDINWAINFIQNIAKYVFKTGNYFEDGHYMPANGPIRAESDTLIHAMIFVSDPELGFTDTPHGRVDFLQIVGITQEEYETIRDNTDKKDEIIQRLKNLSPTLVTDLDRTN